MRTAEGLALVALVIADVTTNASGFIPPSPAFRIRVQNQATEGDNDPDPVEQFMEEASAKGADKVRSMSVEERTRRAMLAEAVEDRIFSLYDDLEEIMKDGVPATDEDRDEAKSLAQEIRASQSQYENLVSGGASAMLGAINDIGSDGKERAD